MAAPLPSRRLASFSCYLLVLRLILAQTDHSCEVLTVSPNSGPSDGGTLVNLTGISLGDGSAWRCNFGDVLVGAEYLDEDERVSCFSPRQVGDNAELPVNVSIDGGSSFCDGPEPLTFRYYPTPNVSSISPASGTTQGATRVTVSGSGFAGLGGDVVCTFGSLRIGDTFRAGVAATAVAISDTQLECDTPNAHASAAVGTVSFTFDNMPSYEVIQPCAPNSGCAWKEEPERLYRFPSGHNVTLLGKAVAESNVIKLTRNLFSYLGAMRVSLYYPSFAAGTPVRDFDASWVQQVGRGSGADGYSFVYADLASLDVPFGEMGVGDGLMVRFRTRGYVGEFNEGHGLVDAVYNGTVLNQTFMGERLRDFYARSVPVRVSKDSSGLSVYFDGVHVLSATIPSWAPLAGWAFAFGGRTGERKDDHWIDDLSVQSGFLLDLGAVEFGVSLNGGADLSLLGARRAETAAVGEVEPDGSAGQPRGQPQLRYTYTSDPSVFSFSPTTGPEQGNTTVRIVGSHFGGGSDHRCLFGSFGTPLNSFAYYDGESKLLSCASPVAGEEQLVPLEVTLNNRADSSSHSNVHYRFYAHPVVADARGPAKHAAPAGVGVNVSLHGYNFTGGDDYRVRFSDPSMSPSIVPATFVNDSLVLCVAPSDIDPQQATVELTLNGQQYTDPMRFPFFAVHSVSPTTGPAAGGTLVLINGTAFDTGGSYRCGFGGVAGVSVASRRDDYTLACYSPPTEVPFGGRPLEVALNALDFTSSNISFSYFPAPSMASVLPVGGPVDGETIVAVRTRALGGLGGGSHYQCAFGSSVVPATYVEHAPPFTDVRGPHNNANLLLTRDDKRPDDARRLATPYDGRRAAYAYISAHGGVGSAQAHGAVLCRAPANVSASDGPLGTLVVYFAVALNGQNFHEVDGGYTYYEPPNVTGIAPLRGPSQGGTLLTLALDATVHPSLLNSTSCRIGGSGDHLPFVHSRAVTARLSPTEQIANGVLQCAVPPANRTGAIGVVSLDFGSELDHIGTLLGHATHVPDRVRPCAIGDTFSCGGRAADGYTSATSAQCEWLCPIRDGHLRLTNGDYVSSGSFIVESPRVLLAPPPRELNASFDLYIGRAITAEIHPFGDGSFTFNFGELANDTNIGLTGAASGLSVQLFFLVSGDRPLRLEVWHSMSQLLTLSLQGGVRTNAWVPMHIEVAFGELSVTANRIRLVDRLTIPDWDPPATWRYGFGGSSTQQRDEIQLDNLELRSASLLSFAERQVEITFNGQQFAPTPNQFGYYSDARFPALVSVSPSSGPIAGGTILSLQTHHIDANLTLISPDPRTYTDEFPNRGVDSTSAYRCFLGTYNITASRENGTRRDEHINVPGAEPRVRCTTLPFEIGGGKTLPLLVSMNAQDPIGPVRPFVVYGPIVVDEATPLSGPAAGGTLVLFKGEMLGNGSDYRCRFGDGPLVEETPGADVVPGTYDNAIGREEIRCVSPPAAEGPANLYVSLNSQNYVRVGALVFHFTAPETPTALSPTTGPSDGDTLITVRMGSALTGAFAPACRWGNEVQTATISSSPVALRCLSPRARTVPSMASLTYLRSVETAPPAAWRHGEAAIQVDGSLRLTAGMESSSGSLVLPASAINATGLSFARFRVTFGLRVFNGDGGDGLSFSYGLLPPGAIGETGAGLGLRVSFLTASRCPPPHITDACPVVEVRYATFLLARVPLDPYFRGESFRRVLIEYTWRGLRVAAGVERDADVEYGIVEYVPAGSLHIEGWAPSREWSMGFGARSGLQTDIHEMGDLTVDFGSQVDATTVPLHVSLNSQQYAPVDVPHMRCWDGCHGDAPDLERPCPEQGHGLCGREQGLYGPSAIGTETRDADARTVGFVYYGSPNVTILSPTTGPALGGSPAMMLGGTGLHTYGGLHGGSHYRCRFGSDTYTTATVSASLDEAYCVAPAGIPTLHVPVALSLNGQQFHAAPSNYDRLASASATSLSVASPTSGPILGGTFVTISLPGGGGGGIGPSLGGGDDYRCRFAAPPADGNDTRTTMYNAEYAGVVSHATYHPINGSVTCVSPPTPSALAASAANFTLQLASNRLHFEKVTSWEYYDDAVISSLSPSSGPLAGGAQLMLIGYGFERGSHPNCWLGDGRSNATAYEGGSRLRCVSPPGNASGAYHTRVRISLNAQQASDEANFSFYPTPSLRELVPDSGDAGSDGDGTLVRVLLDDTTLPPNATLGTDHGSDYRCRFGGTDGADGSVLHPPSYLPLRLEDGRVLAAPTSVRPATLFAPSELRCTAPRAPAAETVNFRVSLNGQQYGPVLPFDLLPPPLISGFETGWSGRLEGRQWADGETDWTGGASGVYSGGALVEVHGHNFANRTQVGGRLSCRFGDPAASVEATFVSDRLVRCYAPSADLSEVTHEVAFDFENGTLPSRGLLVGHATLSDGTLELTSLRADQVGGFVIEPINRGVRYFDARFGVLLGGGMGGDGMSFCYGELSLTTPLTELGTPYDGLCVRLRTHMHLAIEITANGTTLVAQRIGTAIRSGMFMPVRFGRNAGNGAYAAFEPGPEGTAIMLNVSEAELAPLYTPTDTWRFGFGARTGKLSDQHRVDAISITSPAFVSSAMLNFSVANNGQQFSMGTALDFEYYAPPEVSSFSPTSGPITGDTRVSVYGAHFANGHKPFCKFPQPSGIAVPVNASRIDGGAGLVCLSPLAASGVRAPLEVSLNGQQYTKTGLMYDTVAPAVIGALSPSCGPTGGLTIVNVSGAALQGGTHLQCRLTPNRGLSNDAGAKTVPARRSANDSSVLCETPSLVSSVASYRVAPNAQQFSLPSDFAYYPPPVVSISSPSSGPSDGGTVVVVHGSHLTPTASPPADSTCDVVCRFGEQLSAGSIDVPAGTITCESPANLPATGTALPLSISLNRQQYSPGAHTFRYTSRLGLSSVLPRSGPISGGTLVTVRAHDLRGGDDYTCRFVRLSDMSSQVVNASLVDTSVKCTSPAVAAINSALGDAYNFSVSLNRQQYRVPLPYTYVGAPTLSAASPSSGPVDGDTTVRIGGQYLAGGDNYTCRFGDTADAYMASGQLLNLISLASFNETDGFVYCPLPRSPAQGRVSLRVAHNAQQYAPSPLDFDLYKPVQHFLLSPNSGPAEGGTRVNISANSLAILAPLDDSCVFYAVDGVCDEPWVCAAGTDCTDCAELNGTRCGLRPGSDRRCRFRPPSGGSADLLAASVAASVYGDELLCASPAVVPTMYANRSAVYAVHVSLNGQQYTSFATTRFDFYAAPTVSFVSPIGGPSLGGTLITVGGHNLRGGSDYRCEIGSDLVPASFDNLNGTILCTTPSGLPEHPTGAPFSVRLNGQETAPSGSLTFRVSAHPTLAEISPSSGPYLGNTTVRFHGTNYVDTTSNAELRCRFGTHEVPASFDSAARIACVSPHASAAGASATMDVDFTDHDLVAGTDIEPPFTRAFTSGMLLLGSAIKRSSGYSEPHAYIRLTQSAFEAPGSVLLPYIELPHLGAPEVLAGWFDAFFDIRMWGSGAAHGVSFCYGDLPTHAWGEAGASLGLCVQFATRSNRTLVHAHGHLVHNVSVPTSVSIRNRLWRGVHVMLDRAGDLRVEFDGQVLIDRLPIDPPLAPTTTWRFGFGARTGPNINQLEERHDVRNFRTHLGALVGPARLVPQLTLNGQQYIGDAPYVYYPLVITDDVTPVSGPADGSTYLSVRGFRMHNGSDYRCRFLRDDSSTPPRVQDAYIVGDAVFCNSSDTSIGSTSSEVLQVSLNGQQYVPAVALNFTVRAPPMVTAISPTSGPAHGATTVTLTLSEVSAPANHTCRFGAGVIGAGPIVVAASVGTAANTVSCTSPGVIRPVDPLYGPRPLYGDVLPQVALEYSLNAQQYTSDERLYRYTAHPTISSASPSSGPMHGGTHVRLLGSELWAGASDRVCRFGDDLVNASRTATTNELLCIAPASPLATTSAVDSYRPLSVSLNAQQYSPILNGSFHQYRTLVISQIAPASGPALDGGTQITISGDGLVGPSVGSHPSCAFRASGGGARTQLNATLLPSGALRCASPPDLAALDDPMAYATPAAPLELSVSLNGQQFSTPRTFHSYSPHNISLLTPDAGVYLGGTQVNLSLSHRVLNASGVMECRFGGAVVPASVLGDGLDVRCDSPSSFAAGAVPHRAEEFNALPEGGSLLGSARTRRGVLQLTPFSGLGTFVLDMPNLGSSTFTIAFDLLLGTGGGAEGVSISYGVLPPYPLGVTGTHPSALDFGSHAPPEMYENFRNPGVEIWIRTGITDFLQVHHRGVPVGSRKMFGALRTDAFLNASLSVSASGMLEYSFGNGILRDSIQLDRWAPAADWKLAIGAGCRDACAAPENAQWVDNLIIDSDAFVRTADVDLCLAVNGQQCLGSARFAYNALWSMSHVYPRHGPIRGGTPVTVHGSNFPGGASNEYSCRIGSTVHGWRQVAGRLGEVTTSGSWGRPSAALVCRTPEAPQPHEMALELQVSLNQQEYPLGASLGFQYYHHPMIDIVTPVAGPVAGGTLLRVYGAYLHGGASGLRRCRMGNAVVPASLDPASGALLCFSPPAPGGVPAEYPLDLALNVLDFDHGQHTFGYYAPPVISAIDPPSGFSNGTLVTLTGTDLWHTSTFTPLCRFGSALVNASMVDASSVRCVAPSAAAAGAWSRLSLTFSEAWNAQLYGFDAQLRGRAMVHNGRLLLVDHDPLNERQMVGTIVLALPQPALPPAHFKATFKLRMGAGSGADGMSFSYGDVARAPIGELGGGRGLRVCFRTYIHERVEVWYAERLVHISSNESVLTWPSGHTLRASAFVDMHIEYGPDGLTIRHKGVTHAEHLRIDGWAPLNGWRFAIGARAGGRSDDHHIDDLVIEGGGAFAPEAIPLSLTLNGLQFSRSPVPFVYEHETAAEAGAAVDTVGLADAR